MTLAASPAVVLRTASAEDHPRARTRRVPGSGTAFLVGTAVGAAATAWTVSAGTNLDYGDALAHLTIARRITDNMAPGLAQLGTVWLPLPHLLLMPLVQSLWLFETGLAAGILGSLCLGVTALGLWRTCAHLGLSRRAAVAGQVVLLTNLSLLYVSTTALTEPVLLACLSACLAGLSGWLFSARRLSGGELAVFAGFPAAAGVLTRYEAWALALSATVLVAIAVLRRGDGPRRALVLAGSFAAPSAFAVGWWLAYNTAIYGNPLEFLTGEYSAAAFTETYAERGQLTAAGNLGLSVRVLGWGMLETLGLVWLLVAGVGLLLLTFHRLLDDRALLVWVAASPVAFLLFSLVSGNHIMFNDASLPVGQYNNRYVLAGVPWLVLLVAEVVHRIPTVRTRGAVAAAVTVAVLAGAAGQVLWWLGDPGGRMTVFEEGRRQQAAYVAVKDAGAWLGQHYDGGRVLMDESALLVAPVIGLPQREFFNRATGPLFDEALADPAGHARWVLMHIEQVGNLSNASSLDLVTEELAGDPWFHAHYEQVYAVEDVAVYRRLDPAWPPAVTEVAG